VLLLISLFLPWFARLAAFGISLSWRYAAVAALVLAAGGVLAAVIGPNRPAAALPPD
jgi:hypothetical protein